MMSNMYLSIALSSLLILGGMGLMSTYIAFNNNLRWNYLQYPEYATFLTVHQWNRMWLNTKDPTFQGRPA